jgi:hypothetical protein
MRVAAATTVLAAVGLLTGHALAQTVPVPTVPTVPTVTVPAPPVAVPLPTVPKLPPPAVPAPISPPPLQTPSPPPVKPPSASLVIPSSTPVQTPSRNAVAPAVPSVSSGAGSTVGGPAGSRPFVPSNSSVTGSALGRGSGASGGSATFVPRSGATRVQRLRSSRRWIATSGPKRRRLTTLTFVLPRASRVVFVVEQISPVCRIAGRFTVNGRSGLNRIRFPRPASSRRLEPGTYRIRAHTPAGSLVQRVTIVVFDRGAPTHDQIVAARASNVCGTSARLATASGSTGAPNTSGVRSPPLTPGHPSASGPSEGANSRSGAVLGSTVEKAARAIRPVLVALLALAIALLGIAALPRLVLSDSRANELLAEHRAEIAGLGAAAFVAVVVAFLLG